MCKTVVEEKEDSLDKSLNCKCSSLEPASVIDDIKGLFVDSKLNTIFSDEGIK